MNKIQCTLYCHSIDRHLQQLYTGFDLLSAVGIIKVKQIIKRDDNFNKAEEQHLRDAENTCLSVQVTYPNKKKINIYYDTHDAEEISIENLKKHDVYFKRSYSEKYKDNFCQERKNDIYPLGLNYLVMPNRFNRSSFYRQFSLSKTSKEKISAIMHSFDINNKIRFYPKLKDMHRAPKGYQKIKILFMATAWDPYNNPDRSKEKIEERIYINEMRANCIRLLRKEFGNNFYGGLMHNEFTIKMYKDALLENKNNALKKNYINILNEFPICVATMGLHGSIGGKFAEYVAFSKGILSEKMNFQLPGNLEKDKNYLEFTTPEECVNQAVKLSSNKEMLTNMMYYNLIYYHHYVRPDMLILNSLIS